MENRKVTNGLTLLLANRQVFMGLAIIWIYFFHAKRFGVPFVDSINNYGWIGVDVFIYMSAIGLARSLEKNTLSKYFKNRFKRIIPTWIIVLIAIHIIGIIGSKLLPGLPFHYPSELKECILWYTGLGFWLSPIVGDSPNNYYEWYIPTILVFYLIAPIFGKRSVSTLIAFLFSTVILVCIQHHTQFCHELEIATSRLPIFIIGFLYHSCCKEALYERQFYIFGSCALFLLTALYSYSSIITLRVYLAFLIPLVLVLLSFVIGKLKHLAFISFLGSISLEMYLLHLYQRPYYLVSMFISNLTVANFLTFFVVIFAAFLLSKCMKLIVK